MALAGSSGLPAAVWLALAAVGSLQATAQEVPPSAGVVEAQPGDLVQAAEANVADKADRLPPPAIDPSEVAAFPAEVRESLVELGVEERIEQAFAASRDTEAARPAMAWTLTEPIFAYVLNTDPAVAEPTATASLPEAEIDGTVTGAIPPDAAPEEATAEDIPEAAALPGEAPETPSQEPATPPSAAQQQPAAEETSAAAREAEASSPPRSVEAAPDLQSGPTLPPSLLPTHRPAN